MQVARVEAVGFGPLNGAVLDFAEGMTVVFGPNEAGKSSWHSALYAGVCGIRRARGRPSAADQEFERRHRPWDGGPWRVRALVVLADGRRIELTQDLAAREGTAIDLATGRDLTSTILREQVPDASCWLGLDRNAFRAVACVPQTALLQIRDQPGELAAHLQRAAATAGTDATAAEAIGRIDAFITEHVGTDRAWTKPLAMARAAQRRAEQDLDQAAQTHAGQVQLRAQLHRAIGAKEAAERQLGLSEAAYARIRADVARDRWSQADELTVKYPEAPPQLAADDSAAQQARAAVDGYRNRPAVPALEGPSAEELGTELAALPPTPEGDVTPAPNTVDANGAVRDARATLQSVADLQPPRTAALERTSEQTGELRRLADALAEPVPPAEPGNDQQTPHPDPAHPAKGRALFGAGAVVAAILLISGVTDATVARQPTGWAVAAAGAVIGAVLLAAVLRGHTRQIAALRDLQVSSYAGAMRKTAEQRLANARAEVTTLGLPADPDTLRELADADDRARVAARAWNAWQARYTKAESNLHSALGKLARELSTRGVPITQDPEDDFRRYVDDCASRREQAAEADRRPGLEARLRDRCQAEKQATDAAIRRSAADQQLRAAASACQLPDASTAALHKLADAIEDWLGRRAQAIGEHQQAVQDYAVLQQLLDGDTLDDLKDEAARLTQAANVAAEGLDPAAVTGAGLGSDPVATLRKLQDAAQHAREKVTELQTKEQERQRGVSGVAEAEEAVAQATAQVRRLERLSHILGTARSYLEQAQDSVHQTIAPQLANAIAPHLAAITAGRYTEARVDPDDLQVRVREPSGALREAEHLSYGTAEQAYILLRAALAQYLVTTGEPCPLILDDPTAYADESRTTAMLQVLHHVSAERQVIVFSHDTQVLAWARDALNGPADKIIELLALRPQRCRDPEAQVNLDGAGRGFPDHPGPDRRPLGGSHRHWNRRRTVPSERATTVPFCTRRSSTSRTRPRGTSRSGCLAAVTF